VKRLVRSVVASLTIVSLLLISALPALANDDARIRVLHASPDAPAVDIWIDGSIVDGLTNVPFGTISDYMNVPAGTYNVVVVETGTTSPAFIDANVTVDAGMAYTIAATGEAASIGATVLADNPSLDYDNAQVRVVHFSPDAPAVDVAPDGADPVFSNLAFPNDTGYAALPAGTYDLEVRVAGTSDVALQLDPLMLAGGNAYSVFAIGFAAGGDNPLQVLIASDGMMLPDSATITEQAPGVDMFPLMAAALLAVATFVLVLNRSRFAAQTR
jgi:hypothetical protein